MKTSKPERTTLAQWKHAYYMLAGPVVRIALRAQQADNIDAGYNPGKFNPTHLRELALKDIQRELREIREFKRAHRERERIADAYEAGQRAR